MKTKLYFTALLFIGSMAMMSAQAQNQECMTNLSIYVEHAKVKNYDAAYTPWKMVYDNCPDINRANFVYGERILKDKIKKTSGAEKDGFTNDLLALYDDNLKYFPKKTSLAAVIIKKTLFKWQHKMISDSEIYENLDRAFKEDKAHFKNPRAMYLYFSSLVDLYKAGSKDLQEVFDVYDELTEKIEEENKILTDRIAKLLPKGDALTSKEKKLLSAATTNSESFGKIAGSIDSKLGPLADCENLIPLYQKGFDSRKGDVVWVKRAVGLMFAKECTDDPLFVKLVDAQKDLDPSADIYVYLGTLKIKNKDTNGAVADFNKALELETDSYKKSNIAYKVATIYRRKGNKSTSYKYARQAVNANASNGKAYLLMASLIAGSANQCGSTPFEKRATYWKAADVARKAGRVDPSLSGRSNKAALSYSQRAPSKAMIFDAGMAGKTVKFSCWVGGSVVVPSL